MSLKEGFPIAHSSHEEEVRLFLKDLVVMGVLENE